ncbi:MAG: hypothetical protein FWG84_04770 [Bacteroidales bacterium]|nr:hypothetical protein [Bacteroidales bacterium]
MTVVSSEEFVTEQDRYFDMAMNEQVFVQRGDNMFVFACTNDRKKRHKTPDEDFYRAITMDEFKIRAREVVEKAYKRYINERNHITPCTRIS